MNAQEFIAAVNHENENNWANSDLREETEEMLRKIAEHLFVCEKCRGDFDAMLYEEETLIDFERILSQTKLSDWICEK